MRRGNVNAIAIEQVKYYGVGVGDTVLQTMRGAVGSRSRGILQHPDEWVPRATVASWFAGIVPRQLGRVKRPSSTASGARTRHWREEVPAVQGSWSERLTRRSRLTCVCTVCNGTGWLHPARPVSRPGRRAPVGCVSVCTCGVKKASRKWRCVKRLLGRYPRSVANAARGTE